jgi:hypothetical protein
VYGAYKKMSADLEGGRHRKSPTHSGLTKSEKETLKSHGITQSGVFMKRNASGRIVSSARSHGPVRPALKGLVKARHATKVASAEKFNKAVKDLKAVKSAEKKVARKTTGAINAEAHTTVHLATDAIKAAKNKSSPKRKEITEHKTAKVVKEAQKVVDDVIHMKHDIAVGHSSLAKRRREHARGDHSPEAEKAHRKEEKKHDREELKHAREVIGHEPGFRSRSAEKLAKPSARAVLGPSWKLPVRL